MKYNFGEKKNLNRKNNATETENTKKKKGKTETILSYLTQHKTQRNLGGVIYCRHMWKFRDAYIDLKMYMLR